MLIFHHLLWLTGFLGGQHWAVPHPMCSVMLVQRNPTENPLLLGYLLSGGFRDLSRGPSCISILGGYQDQTG